MALTDYERHVCTRGRHRGSRRIRQASRSTAVVAAVLLAMPAAGCGFAVKHPALAAGIVGGTLAFSTCKLASDDYPACLGVGGGAGAFLGLAAAAALWLGGDGHTVLVEEQAKPLPEDGRPIRHHPRPVDPEDPAPSAPATAPSAPTPDPAPPAPVPTTPAPLPAPAPAPAAPPGN